MVGRLRIGAIATVAQASVAVAWAQPVDIPLPAATTTEFPAGIAVAKVPGGQVYVDAQGRTLYGMDMRMVARWSVDTSKYCAGARCKDWEPVLAPPGSTPNLLTFRGIRGGPNGAGAPKPPAASAAAPGKAGGEAENNQAKQLALFFGQGTAPKGMYTQANAPDWTIVDGPTGPQWVYKAYNLVYVRKGDKPRSTQFDGAEGQVWNTLKYVPPVPKLTAPGGVGSTWVKDGYLLTDKDGKLLYTGRCAADCTAWKPLPAGAASQGLGEWTVDRAAPRPQWLYHGKPVYVAADDSLTSLPRATVALRP